MAAVFSWDDELMHSLSMESRNGESKDLMEAVKEGRRALSPTNESEEERERETGQKRVRPAKDTRAEACFSAEHRSPKRKVTLGNCSQKNMNLN